MIYLASSPEAAEVTGQYFCKRRAVPPSEEAQDDDKARRLWVETERLANRQSG